MDSGAEVSAVHSRLVPLNVTLGSIAVKTFKQ